MMSIVRLFLILTLPFAIFAEDYYYDCVDTPHFWWRYNNRNGQTYQHGCSYLTNSSNQQQNIKRQNIHCNRVGKYGILVKDGCRRSCNNCDNKNDDYYETDME